MTNHTRLAWRKQNMARLGPEGVPARTNQVRRYAIAAAATARWHTLGMTMTEATDEIVVPAGCW